MAACTINKDALRVPIIQGVSEQRTMYDIYSSTKNDNWRYSLGKSGNRNLIVIGLNPSTANKEKSDTTVAKVEQVASSSNFDGFVMLNLYPVRATKYEDLEEEPNQEAFLTNLQCIKDVVSNEKNPFIWAAWGESILSRKYFVDSVAELFHRLKNCNATWNHFGSLTRSGHPRHPSRLSYSWDFSRLDLREYFNFLDSIGRLRN